MLFSWPCSHPVFPCAAAFCPVPLPFSLCRCLLPCAADVPSSPLSPPSVLPTKILDGSLSFDVYLSTPAMLTIVKGAAKVRRPPLGCAHSRRVWCRVMRDVSSRHIYHGLTLVLVVACPCKPCHRHVRRCRCRCCPRTLKTSRVACPPNLHASCIAHIGGWGAAGTAV